MIKTGIKASSDCAHSPHSRARRLGSLWPIFLLLFVIVATDQILLSIYPDFEIDQYDRRIDAAAKLATPGRPKFLLLGSSRTAVFDDKPAKYTKLRDTLGQKYDFVNLTRGGGTPSLMWTGISNYSRKIGGLPPNSYILYIFSAAEMNFLNLAALNSIPEGRQLARELDASRWFKTLYDRSFISRYVSQGAFKKMLPDFLVDFQDKTISAHQSGSMEKYHCATFGYKNFNLLPINIAGFEKLAAFSGGNMLVVRAPVSSIQQACDRTVGVWQQTTPFLSQLRERYNFLLIDKDTRELFGLTDQSFFDGNDASHVYDATWKDVMISRLLKILPNDF